MQQKSIDNSSKERYITVTKYEKQISRRKKDGNEKIEKSGDDSGSQYVCNDDADDPDTCRTDGCDRKQ